MLLALDRSTTPASASVFSPEGEHLATITDADTPAPADAYALAMRALAAAHIQPAQLRRFAAATGPGSFSGIRSALALLNGLAIPISAEVTGIPTPAAIWRAFKTLHPETPAATIIGDARRGKLWLWESAAPAPADAANAAPDAAPPRLIELSRWENAVPPALTLPIITPDLRRLAPFLSRYYPAEQIHQSPPLSRAVCELALEGMSHLPLPIYLSAAVEPPPAATASAAPR